jgi:hypothetical protein
MYCLLHFPAPVGLWPLQLPNFEDGIELLKYFGHQAGRQTLILHGMVQGNCDISPGVHSMEDPEFLQIALVLKHG